MTATAFVVTTTPTRDVDRTLPRALYDGQAIESTTERETGGAVSIVSITGSSPQEAQYRAEYLAGRFGSFLWRASVHGTREEALADLVS